MRKYSQHVRTRKGKNGNEFVGRFRHKEVNCKLILHSNGRVEVKTCNGVVPINQFVEQEVNVSPQWVSNILNTSNITA